MDNINSRFVLSQLDALSLSITKETVIVLDNASVHRANCIKERLSVWASRGLHIFYLPPYSPHLNLAEVVWRKLKAEWLQPQDYIEDETLKYAVNRCLANIGKNLTIKFSSFSLK